MQNHDSASLETQVSLEVLSNLSLSLSQGVEGQLVNEQFSAPLVMFDFTKCNSTCMQKKANTLATTHVLSIHVYHTVHDVQHFVCIKQECKAKQDTPTQQNQNTIEFLDFAVVQVEVTTAGKGNDCLCEYGSNCCCSL